MEASHSQSQFTNLSNGHQLKLQNYIWLITENYDYYFHVAVLFFTVQKFSRKYNCFTQNRPLRRPNLRILDDNNHSRKYHNKQLCHCHKQHNCLNHGCHRRKGNHSENCKPSRDVRLMVKMLATYFECFSTQFLYLLYVLFTMFGLPF